MTDRFKERDSLTVSMGDSERFRPESRAFLFIGVVLSLIVPGSASRAMPAQPGWWEEISPAGLVFIQADGVSRSEAHEYLDGLGLLAGTVADPEVGVHGRDAFHGVQEARADWAVTRLELNGKFALRRSTEVLGHAMTMMSVIGSDGLLTTDDRGGSRIETYRKFPDAACDRGDEGTGCDDPVSFDAARDGRGVIVEFIRDRKGFPSGVRFGETLFLRYDFTPPLPEPPSYANVRAGDVWREPSSWELIDLRTSEIVVDSVDAGKVASERTVFSVGFLGIGEVLRVEAGDPFAVALGRGYSDPAYALLPIEATSEVWRIVYAYGDQSWRYKFRVDYTDDLVRAEIKTEGLLGPSIVVQAPRSLESTAPVSIVHPGADSLTAAMRSEVRLRVTESLEPWLRDSFKKEELPIVLRPFHSRGLETPRVGETGIGVIREAAGVRHDFDFGPADGCEEEDGRVVCSGGASEVVGEEYPHPW